MCKNDDNILVWSHYADQHRGFCIKFDRESNNVLGKTERTKPIEYKDDYPDVDLFDPTGKINESIFKDMFFIKTKGWEYEWEWRFVCDEGDKEEPMPFNISSIIFGLKMPQRHRDTIINILSGQGISFKEAVKADNQFKINIIDLPE